MTRARDWGKKKYKLGCFVRKINTSTRRMACIYLGDEWMGCIKKDTSQKRGTGEKDTSYNPESEKKIQATIRTGVKREFCANSKIISKQNHA